MFNIKRRMIKAILTIVLLAIITGCGGGSTGGHNYKELTLANPYDDPKMEYSGLAWMNDTLILLPQYPNGYLYAIPKMDLELEINKKEPLPFNPVKIPINDMELKKSVPGYEGFEALVFDGDKVYFMIESEVGESLAGYIIKGRYLSVNDGIELDHNSLIRIETPVGLNNMAFESLILWNDYLIPFYEANGVNVNPSPSQPVFNKNFELLEWLPFGALEYRITDATDVDESGAFWLINYMWDGDRELLNPGLDQIRKPMSQEGINKGIERLVEYKITTEGIFPTGNKAIWLADPNSDKSNNWEGIVRYGDRGFIIVTDKFSRTILAFVKR